MSINGEVITTSGFAEVTLEVLNIPIGLSVVEKIDLKSGTKCQISCEIITAK